MTISEQPSDHVDEILTQWSEVKPDLDASPMGIIGRICRLSVFLVKEQVRVFEQYNLDFASFDVLATLFRNGPSHKLTPTQLAHSMIVTPGAVTQRLARLEEKGLIVRTHNTGDRRVVSVQLTDEGKQLVEAVLPDHLSNEQRMLSQFNTDELEDLASLLRRMLVSQGDYSI